MRSNLDVMGDDHIRTFPNETFPISRRGRASQAEHDLDSCRSHSVWTHDEPAIPPNNIMTCLHSRTDTDAQYNLYGKCIVYDKASNDVDSYWQWLFMRMSMLTSSLEPAYTARITERSSRLVRLVSWKRYALVSIMLRLLRHCPGRDDSEYCNISTVDSSRVTEILRIEAIWRDVTQNSAQSRDRTYQRDIL
jgi:hypothetical protein